MEWVNTTAKSVDEAIELALDNLGVDQAEAEIVVVEEPKLGLFGRFRGSARIKARVKPLDNSKPRPTHRSERRRKPNRPNKRRSSNDSSNETTERNTRQKPKANKGSGRSEGKRSSFSDRPKRNEQRDQQKEASVEEVSGHLSEFLSGLSTAFGYEAVVRVDEVEDNGVVALIEEPHGLLVGPKGRTLDAIQELSRMSAQRSVPSSVRITIDVGGYRARRADALEAFAVRAAHRATNDGVEVALEPMSSSDRKVVHSKLLEVGGVETRSVGQEPRRHIVVVPLAGATSNEAE